MKRSISPRASLYVAVLVALPLSLMAQHDPGPRGGPAAAGGFYPTLNGNEQAMFNTAQQVFQEIDSVSGKVPGEDGSGLGPTFNGNSCAQCHAQPAVGGSSPGQNSPQHPIPNPQVTLATLDGANNRVPSFITAEGPVREARFVRTSSGSADGGVHDLYTIAGRTDAPGCGLGQPDFDTQIARNNVIFRIPTPVYGLGLVEATPDAVLQANLAANQNVKTAMGIRGAFNSSGNDGTITRFGWKAQNKSLMMFSGEAYNVEQGVSNEVFPNERSAVSGCVFNGTPEDATGESSSQANSDVVSFATFARLSAPPTPAKGTRSTQNGAALFVRVGCALCHSSDLTTGMTRYTGMSNTTYHPYSDFALHHMGSGLADGIAQGAAGPDQFRTAPLWGVGQRLFFLHDGRTSDLLQAIQAHSSRGSEANTVVRTFQSLSPSQVQDILNFLRSL
jgi:CxxC motif-containing protein (DUF1111 family)